LTVQRNINISLKDTACSFKSEFMLFIELTVQRNINSIPECFFFLPFG